MEKNVRILVVFAAGLALLTAFFGLVPPSISDLMPGASVWLAGIRGLGDQGTASLVINTITLTLGMFMVWITYFLPTGIALQSRHPQCRLIMGVNILLGWTLIGWFVAFFWVLRGAGEKS